MVLLFCLVEWGEGRSFVPLKPSGGLDMKRTPRAPTPTEPYLDLPSVGTLEALRRPSKPYQALWDSMGILIVQGLSRQ